MKTTVNYEQVYISKLQKIEFSKDYKLLKNIWLKASSNINLATMQAEMTEWMRAFEQTKPTVMMTFNSDAQQVLIKEIQDWISTFLFPKIVIEGVSKWAVITSLNIYSTMSADKMLNKGIEKIAGQNFECRFFIDEHKASTWLIKS